MWRKGLLLGIVLLYVGLLVQRVWNSVSIAEKTHEHGAHGGIVASLGDDEYHVEAVFTKERWLKLYTLGPDETRLLEVESQTLTAHVLAEGDVEAYAIDLRPEPQPGDASGRTSCFRGKLPEGLDGRALRVSVPNLRVGGERLHLAFARPAAEHLPEMPAKIGENEERDLYLVPGGAYTATDIEANGRMVPSQKYRGFRARHDLDPGPGDRLCPVTRTKANPDCTWTIAGRTYQFCCPPCIDEFVRLAKEHPDRLLPPKAYSK